MLVMRYPKIVEVKRVYPREGRGPTVRAVGLLGRERVLVDWFMEVIQYKEGSNLDHLCRINDLVLAKCDEGVLDFGEFMRWRDNERFQLVFKSFLGRIEVRLYQFDGDRLEGEFTFVGQVSDDPTVV